MAQAGDEGGRRREYLVLSVSFILSDPRLLIFCMINKCSPFIGIKIDYIFMNVQGSLYTSCDVITII